MKTRNDWANTIGNDGKVLISEYVEAAECIVNGGKGYCLDKPDAYFDGWKLEYIKQKIKENANGK